MNAITAVVIHRISNWTCTLKYLGRSKALLVEALQAKMSVELYT